MSGIATASAAPRGVLPVRWLLSRRADLTFLIGSVAVSYALLFLWQSGRLSLSGLVLLWIFALHGPHFYGTLSRTFLDPTEWRERGSVFRRSFLWFLVGPVVVGAGLLVQRATGYGDLTLLFFFLAAVWAFQHVVKQHFGFVALYRAKHLQFDRPGFLFLKYYLIVSLWAPVLVVLIRTPLWFEKIPLAMVWGRSAGYDAVVARTDVAGSVFMAIFWGAQVALVLWLVSEVVRGRGINLPALLILLASVPFNYLAARACLTAGLERDPIEAYAFVPLVTSYHNIQYHALIWHFNRVKYGSGGEQYGLAARLNKNLAIYFGCGLIYTLVTIGIEQYSVYDVAALARGTYTGELLAAAIWGFSFLHYYVDAQIWHVRSDENLQRLLGFAKPKT